MRCPLVPHDAHACLCRSCVSHAFFRRTTGAVAEPPYSRVCHLARIAQFIGIHWNSCDAGHFLVDFLVDFFLDAAPLVDFFFFLEAPCVFFFLMETDFFLLVTTERAFFAAGTAYDAA